jgi:hypothetical protein
MNELHEVGLDAEPGIGLATKLSSEQCALTEGLLREILEGSPPTQPICDQVLQHCRAQRISEREFWRLFALYRADGTLSGAAVAWGQEFARCEDEKLRKRILELIGRLPRESLEDFAGLVAFTSIFAARVQFLCDLLVYLFAEREKGGEGHQSEGRLYTEFFAAKLMWELDVMRRIGEQYPPADLADQYLDWLTDRILDGEVLI